MVLLSFKSILFVITSNCIEIRTNILMNALFISELFKCDYKIIWKTSEQFKLDMSDIYNSPCFRDKLIKDTSEVTKSGNYYYNPKINVETLLTNSVSNGIIVDESLNIDHRKLDWLIVENVNDKIHRMIPSYLVSNIDYNVKMRSLYKAMTFNSNVEGYLNVFKKMLMKNDTIAVYIPDPSHSFETYANSVDELGTSVKIFLSFSANFDTKGIDTWTTYFKNRYSKERCICVHRTESNEQLIPVLQFACLTSCGLIATSDITSTYLREIVLINDDCILYNIEKRTAHNITCGQLLSLVKPMSCDKKYRIYDKGCF
jgi:hypothetical protein